MVYSNRFFPVWNAIKKFPSFIGKKVIVEQLNDTTVFPWFINFSKNFYEDYRKCKSNNWNYLISIHDFNNCNDSRKFNDKNLISDRTYFIKKYNERLLTYSKNKADPWIVNDRENKFLVLNKKNYLELEEKLNFIIYKEIEKKCLIKKLTEKSIRAEKKRLAQLLKLALLKTLIGMDFDEFDAKAIAFLDWNKFYNHFIKLSAFDPSYAVIQNEIKAHFKKNHPKISVPFLNEKDLVEIYPEITIWEKINKIVVKNKIIKFFYLLWSGFIGHASVLNWVSFLFLFFSLSIYTCPIIFLMLGLSLISYFIIHFVFLIKNDPIIPFKVDQDEADKLIEIIKKEVFSEMKNEYEFNLIHEIVFDLFRKKLNINEFLNSILTIQKNFSPIYCPSVTIKQSALFRHLSEVYPKTQFIASLTINLSSVILYTYLLTWAIQSCLTVLGAVSLGVIFSSPITVGLLILIFSSIFLINHLFEFSSREAFYQRTILNRINEKCEYHYKDEYGQQRVIQLEKWKKFEYLQDNIRFLESEFKKFFKKNNLAYVHNKFYWLFDTYIKKNIYSTCDHDKLLAESCTTTKRIKKILNRLFSFLGGSFYGYSLSQQIITQNKWGLHVFKLFTLPAVLIFLPLIILNGIANFITYHLHSRQYNRFEMAKNLDNTLEILEKTNKKLLYLATLLSLEVKYSSNQVINESATLEKQVDELLLNKKKADYFFFFKEMPKNKIISEKQRLFKNTVPNLRTV